MPELTYQEYLQHLDAWLPLKGFKSLQGGKFDALAVDRLYHQYKASWAFGSRHTICFIKYSGGQPVLAAEFQNFSQSCYRFAQENNTEWPAGFLARIVVIYPLIVTDALADETRAYVQEYHTRHFARFEFPAVFELNVKRLTYCFSPQLYGAALYPILGKELEALFTP